MLGVTVVQRFPSQLAVERSVAAKTRSLACNAIALMFKYVLGRPLENVKFSKTRRQTRVPVVSSRNEVRSLLGQLDGTTGLMAFTLNGTGIRLMECLPGHSDVSTSMIYTKVVPFDKTLISRVLEIPESGRKPEKLVDQ